MNEFFKGIAIGGICLVFMATLVFMWGFTFFLMGYSPPDILFTVCVVVGSIGATAFVIGGTLFMIMDWD